MDATFSGIISNAIALISGIIGLGILIGIHECGHFLMCQLFGIATPSFSIGFGPKIFSHTFSTTTFTLRALPLGGYVEIAGLAEPGQGEQKEQDRDDERSFQSKSYYQKLLVALGGIISNIILSLIIFTGILYIGAPKTHFLYPYNAHTTISHIDFQDNQEQAYRLSTGDTITHIGDTEVTSDAQAALRHIKEKKQSNEANITVTYRREGTTYQETIAITDLINAQLTFEIDELQARSLWHAARLSWTLAYTFVGHVFSALYQLMFQGQTQNVGGPVMIIAASMKGAHHGLSIFLLFLGFLSINLAAFNILPIPVLDGGHIMFLTIEHITGRKISDRVRGVIDFIFAIIMIIFIISASFFDIWRLLGW